MHANVQHSFTSALSFDDALRRARADYLEMPGLVLTADQARRLWALDPTTCRAVLDRLVTTHFLKRVAGSTFVRAST